ncbi:MAG TPA: RNA polymerase sigma factor [Cyclobacteriaceae bacterium]|nr:RNA polymerase sigma factor [Cyclobacteriaceae bacterium]
MISEKQYNETVKDFTRNVYRFVFKSVRDKEATEDIVQDCFMKLWQNRTQVDASKARGWLFTVAHHAMINYLKIQNRNTTLDHVELKAAAAAKLPDFDLKEIIERSLLDLPPLQRSIILLRDLEGYNYKEIGEILQLGESQVKVYLFRGRKKIKDSIKVLSAVI